MNIFLAILINGYSAIQDDSENEFDGILTEITEIIIHEVNRFIKFFYKGYSFISNEEIAARISAKIGTSHYDSTIDQYTEIKLAGMMEIDSSTGILMKTSDVRTILLEFFPEQFASEQSAVDRYLDPTLNNIMNRFGKMSRPRPLKLIQKEQSERFIKRMELETMRRIAKMELLQSGQGILAEDPNSGQLHQNCDSIGEPYVQHCVLSVVIERARNLPRMDVFRGADAYCLIFLEDAPGIFQTEVRRGLREEHWTWDPELSKNFVWNFPTSADLLSERKIVVMVYDKDQLSSDDLIGCVTVSLSELGSEGCFEGWKEIVRPRKSSRFQLPLRKPLAELKLRVTLKSESEREDGCTETAFSSPDARSPARALKSPQSPRFSLTSSLGFPGPGILQHGSAMAADQTRLQPLVQQVRMLREPSEQSAPFAQVVYPQQGTWGAALPSRHGDGRTPPPLAGVARAAGGGPGGDEIGEAGERSGS